MPIPGIKIASPGYIQLEILEEGLRAGINRNSRYSFLKKEIIRDSSILVENHAINIRVNCNGISDSANFILESFPEEDALLGTDFLNKFKLI